MGVLLVVVWWEGGLVGGVFDGGWRVGKLGGDRWRGGFGDDGWWG